MSETQPLYRPFRPPESEPTISLNWKVLGVIVTTVALCTLSILFYLRVIFQERYGAPMEDQLRAYATLAAREARTAESEASLREALVDLPFELRVERENGGPLSTSPSIPAVIDILERGEVSALDEPGEFYLRKIDTLYYAVVKMSDRTTVVALPYRMRSEMLFPASIAVVLLLMGLILAAWRVIRALLRPVGELMEGVKRVGSGDFSSRVPVRSPDELGTLVSAFNAMSEQIEQVIESKRRLLFDVSHELRTPLTRMGIVISMLPPGKSKDRLERNANELATMITELLENERLAVLGAEIVEEQLDLVDLARKVIDSFMDEEDRFRFDTLTEELTIYGDLQRLTVALRNLMSNALKYSDPTANPVEVTVFPDDDGARVTVRDYGIGIPEESLDKVFEPFYRTDESRTRTTGGYGLGLSLTKSIIDAHGGTIRVESKMGEGTTIMIWLPDRRQGVDAREEPMQESA